jgi:hypothetical protein
MKPGLCLYHAALAWSRDTRNDAAAQELGRAARRFARSRARLSATCATCLAVDKRYAQPREATDLRLVLVEAERRRWPNEGPMPPPWSEPPGYDQCARERGFVDGDGKLIDSGLLLLSWIREAG